MFMLMKMIVIRKSSIADFVSGYAIYRRHLANHDKLECGPMPNVMAAQPNIGGALCESSVIPFLVRRHKVWLTAAARVPCSNAANIGERKTWMQNEFCS